MNEKYYELMKDATFKIYTRALARLASGYVSLIRVQFAEKAIEMYENETVRQIVLAYWEEIKQLDGDRVRDFQHVICYGPATPECLNDSCLNKAKSYADTVKLLFDIK